MLRLTYRELNVRANCLANWLANVAGVEKGDRVAILARDGVEHLDAFFACGKLGAVHTALNWRLHGRELAGLIEKTAPKVLIYSDDFREVAQFLHEVSHGRSHSIGQYLHCEGGGIPDSCSLQEIMDRGNPEAVGCESLDMEDTACLLFTGAPPACQRGQ